MPERPDISSEVENMIAESLGIPELTEALANSSETNELVANALNSFEKLPNNDKNAILQAINFELQPHQSMNSTEQKELAQLKKGPVPPDFLTDLS